MGSQRDYRNIPFRLGERANLLGRLDAIQLRLLDVHRYDIVIAVQHGIDPYFLPPI